MPPVPAMPLAEAIGGASGDVLEGGLRAAPDLGKLGIPPVPPMAEGNSEALLPSPGMADFTFDLPNGMTEKFDLPLPPMPEDEGGDLDHSSCPLPPLPGQDDDDTL